MKRLWPILLFACLYALGPLPSLMAVSGLGGWHKDDEHGFWVRVPEEWKKLKIPASEKHLVGKWRGPKMTLNLKKLGTASFYAESSVIWLEVKAKGGLTQPPAAGRGESDSEGEEEEGGELTEAERKKLLKERQSRLKARSFEQWLNNFSGLTGVRMLGQKETKVAKLPAVEYEFLSKTNRQANIKHLAVAVRISDYHEVVLLYSILEDEYREWRPLMRKCINTLKITAPEKYTAAEIKKLTAPARKREPDPADLEFLDVLITHHGKFIEGKVAETDGGYEIDLGGEKIQVPASLVDRVEYGNPEAYVAVTDKEKEMQAKGYMKFHGRWVMRSRYELEQKKERAKLKAKIEDLKKHPDPADPWQEKTTRFIVETTTSEELLKHYTELLECHFSAFEKYLKVNVTSEARKRKPTVRIFKDQSEYMAFTKAGGTAGYFSFADNTLHLYHNFEDPGLTEWVLLHEGTHLLNYLSNPSFAGRPHWIEEGTAEFFGSSTLSRDKYDRLLLEPGQILGNRLLLVNKRIQRGDVKKLRDALSTKSYKYEDYAYWWSTVHFLMTHPKYGPKFLKFYRKLYSLNGVKKISTGNFFRVTPEDSVQLFEKSLKIRDWDALQAEWEEFIKISVAQVGGYGWMVLGRDLYLESFKKKDDDKVKQLEMLAESLEALNKAIQEKKYLKAGAFYYRSMVYKELEFFDEALKDINEAIQRDPLNARYYSRRAVIHYRDKRKDEALRNMKIAIALNPLDLLLPLVAEEMKQGTYIDLSRG